MPRLRGSGHRVIGSLRDPKHTAKGTKPEGGVREKLDRAKAGSYDTIVLRHNHHMPRSGKISNGEYQARAEFRYQIRRFLRLSEREARAAGLEPQQHQMLVALKGLPAGSQPTIGELAGRMLIQHHSAVELVDRLAQRGMLRRARSGPDRRLVYLSLTAKGERVLARVSLRLRDELHSAGRGLVRALAPLLKSR